jgi:HSP20 family protein
MLLNYEPFSPADAFHLLDRLTAPGSTNGRTVMPMDVYRLGDHVVAAFDLPGVDPGSVDVTVEGNALTVRAERTPLVDAGADWIAAERPRGTYQRRLMLGRDLDPDRLTAAYRDGVLTITLPIAERAKPRRVAIDHTTDEHGTEQQVLEAPAR